VDNARRIRNAANVFQYLQDPKVSAAFQATSKDLELMFIQFDKAYWGRTAEKNAKGRKPGRPSRVAPAVKYYGLRSLYCYWRDNHMYRIERYMPTFVADAKANLTLITSVGQSAFQRLHAA
jgi:hypothetical protein